MRKKCLTCNKEWVEGKLDDGLISHGVCSKYCGDLLELWSYQDRGMTLRDFYRLKQTGKGVQS